MPNTLGPFLLVVLGAACGGPPSADSDGTGDGAPVDGGTGLAGELLVSAAASLTDAFAEIASAFEGAHPNVVVTLNVAGSSALRAQILEGAPVDVFAPADRADMQRVVEAGEVRGRVRVFATNVLRIAVPPGNPAQVTGLEDFARGELVLGLCGAQVPCGAFARRALARAGVEPAIDTHEPDVRALLTKIELGEVDAGITYATDVRAAGGAVEGIDIPDAHNVVAEYPVAVLAGAPNPEAARAFVAYVLSAAGRAILARHGFAFP